MKDKMKRIMYLALLVSSPLINLHAEPMSSIEAKVRCAKFKEVEASLNNAHFSQEEIDQILAAILGEFGRNITIKNFDEVYRCIKILLDNGADPDECRYEPSIMYVMNHQYLIFELENARLYKAWEMHSEPFSLSDPLGPSVINDCPKRTLIITQTCRLIDLLVKYGADPNEELDDYQSLLNCACHYMDAPEVVACLLEHGAQPNDFNEVYIFESCTPSDFKKYEKLFAKCSFSYLYINYKRYLIKKFLNKIEKSNTNSLAKEQQEKIKQLKKAFKLRLLRLKKAKCHLQEKGAQNLPPELGLRLIKKLGLKEYLEGSLEELYDDLFE